jgi:hypothetical protein
VVAGVVEAARAVPTPLSIQYLERVVAEESVVFREPGVLAGKAEMAVAVVEACN